MRLFYNLLINLLITSIKIGSFFNKKMKIHNASQLGLIKRISEITKNYKNIVWFHVASMGEFEQAKPLLINYKKKYLHHKILLTVFSPSAFEIIKTTNLAKWTFILPFDTKNNAQKFIDNVRPIKAIFIKYEFWYNYLNKLVDNQIPIYYISAIFRKNQYFFKFYGKWFAKQLQKINFIYVQNEESKSLLKSIGINKVEVVGDTRVDSVQLNLKTSYSNRIIESFAANKQVLIAGSIYKNDLKILIEIIKSNLDFLLIIVPHTLVNIDYYEKKINDSVTLSRVNEKTVKNYRVLIIDQIGILSKIYRFGNIAYIGGGFNNGIHNILEPIVYKIPVIFGPNYHKFQEAIDLIRLGIAASISHHEDSILSMKKLNNKHEEVKIAINKYIQNYQGATNKIIKKI